MLKKTTSIAMTSALATGLLLASQVPALANSEFEIRENGRDSDNTIFFFSNKSTEVTQSNVADIDNDVRVTANTGGLEASDNHGDVTLESGDVDTDITIRNEANSNKAVIDSCGCEENISAVIENNGRDSDSTIVVKTSNETTLDQSNDADFDNNVKVNANTGGSSSSDNNSWNKDSRDWQDKKDWNYDSNKWKENDDDWKDQDWWKNNHSGNNFSDNNGDTEVTSGDVTTDIMIQNMANSNFATL